MKPRTRNRFRPELEQFEAREVPAQFDWIGGFSTLASNPANWLIRGSGAAVRAPGSGDDLYFNAPLGVGVSPLPGGSSPPPTSSVDCYLTSTASSSSQSFASIHIGSSYTATVTFGQEIEVGTFEMAGGFVSQPNSGTDLTVTSSFTWTNGTLNSSDHLANVTLDGATGLIAPQNAGTVSLGSNLNISGGAVATMKAGTINVTNDDMEVNINAASELLVDPRTPVTAAVGINGGAQLNIRENAWFKVISGDFVQEGPAKNTGGSLLLQSGTTASFQDSVDKGAIAATYVQTAGATYIAADASLSVDFKFFGGGMKMSGGLISIASGNQPENFAGNIIGDLSVFGGDIRFESTASGDNYSFGTFVVSGDVYWSGGTYHPHVSTENNNVSDVWKVGNRFSIVGTAAVAPTGVDGENNEAAPAANMHWHLFIADESIYTDGNNPSLSSGWTFDKDPNDPRKWYDLRKN